MRGAGMAAAILFLSSLTRLHIIEHIHPGISAKHRGDLSKTPYTSKYISQYLSLAEIDDLHPSQLYLATYLYRGIIVGCN
jgi:hypothetical protein